MVIRTPERNRQQGQIVAALFQRAAWVPCERVAVIAGGLPGGDKLAVLAAASADRARCLTVSVGTVLGGLAAAGMIPLVAGLSPMEAADLVHAEAQFGGKRAALRALEDGRNLILDVSMASAQSVTSWLSALRSAGYAVTGSSPTSASRNLSAAPTLPTGAARRSIAAAPGTAACTSRPRPSGPWPAARATRPTATGPSSAAGLGCLVSRRRGHRHDRRLAGRPDDTWPGNSGPGTGQRSRPPVI
jgi:hypothetical protein